LVRVNCLETLPALTCLEVFILLLLLWVVYTFCFHFCQSQLFMHFQQNCKWFWAV
jgi:hypothetical protein